MGLTERGFVLRLVRYAKKLPPFIFKISQPSLVSTTLSPSIYQMAMTANNGLCNAGVE